MDFNQQWDGLQNVINALKTDILEVYLNTYKNIKQLGEWAKIRKTKLLTVKVVNPQKIYQQKDKKKVNH